MDAKKAAKVIKNKKFIGSKGFKFTNAVALSLTAYVVLFGFGCVSLYEWLHNKPMTSRNKLFQDYYTSEEFRIAQARYLGFIPPPKDVIERYKRNLESPINTKMNLLNEDLDDSALLSMKITQKRKASGNLNHKLSKQTKLSIFPQNKSEDATLSLNETTSNKKSDSQLDESTSCYFGKKKSSNTCPLCLKAFESDSNYLAHMKQCAKKKDMTTQQLLNALELQKKQIEERRALGLCSQVTASAKKPVKKKSEKDSDYDLALGIALSKSLETNPVMEVEKNAFTLLTSSKAGPSKKRGKLTKKSVLRERSTEERQRIITEKAAVVLLDENDDLEASLVRQEFPLKSMLLSKLQNQECHLWKLSENDNNTSWIVLNLRNLISDCKAVDRCISVPTQPVDIQPFITTLNLPKSSVYQSWEKMINNDKLSDITVKSKDSQTVYLHSVVLYTKCPAILKKNFESIFQKYNLSTILIFLEYVYCGTLKKLQNQELKSLLTLASEFDYRELSNVLFCVEVSLSESSSEIIPSSVTPKETKPVDEEIAVLDEEKKADSTLTPQEDDMMMVDLTQSSHSTIKDENEEKSEDESNVEKSYWSFIQNEKKREKFEEMKRQEEEKEIRMEMEKIESSMKKQQENMQKILDEFEIEESSLKNELEFEKIYSMQRKLSNDSTTSDLDLKGNKFSNDCIVLSSDSETPVLNTEPVPSPLCKPFEELEYEVPVFDPYDDYPQCSPPEEKDLVSQSFITGDVSFELPNSEDKGKMSPEYFSTPISNRLSAKVHSSALKSLKKNTRRRTDLTASRIIRKSLNLKKRNSAKKKITKKERSLAESLANSILSELAKSPLLSTPLRSKGFIEMTPHSSKDLEFRDSDTPSPNFSKMEESLLKEHLSKYGLKKNLGKTKAKKILRHIFEELHPILNTETGKLVKIFPNDCKDKKKTKGAQKKVKGCQQKPKIKTRALNLPEKSDQSKKSSNSLDMPTDYDSDGSEFGDFNEPYTQSVPNNPNDLPSALNEYFLKNPEFHQKILLYEPIWLEELQKNLKETFKKHFKLSDLINYLDQKCITFRSAAQKRNNEKKNQKKKSGKSSV